MLQRELTGKMCFSTRLEFNDVGHLLTNHYLSYLQHCSGVPSGEKCKITLMQDAV